MKTLLMLVQFYVLRRLRCKDNDSRIYYAKQRVKNLRLWIMGPMDEDQVCP